MQYVRHLDPSALDPNDFDAVTLVDTETAWVVAVGVPVGWVRPFPHTHQIDQLYWIIEGELTIVLDGVEHVAGPNTLVYIPAGVVHKNRNDGSVAELHLDFMVPAPTRTKPASTPATEDDRGPGTAWLYELGSASYEPSHVDGFELARIASAATGASIVVNAARVGPDSPGTSWHIHTHDQMYWVLEGAFHLEIADQVHDVTPGHLVVIPAGVPHRNWNLGPGVERHLAFGLPAPQERGSHIEVSWQVGTPLA
ncbi:MAG TPA: cupin domain-containing protein [Ilumatobacteraceae bacterium]|nr:cupin domain-containing protein [Ilumatobacteraceae bacterium]